MRKLPRIGRIDNHRKNTCAKCYCGELGKYKVHVEFTVFRGEDEVAWACEEHKSNVEFLIEGLMEGLME